MSAARRYLRYIPRQLFVVAMQAGAKRDRQGRLYFEHLQDVPAPLLSYVVAESGAQVVRSVVPPTPERSLESIEAAEKFAHWFEGFKSGKTGRAVR